MCNVAVLCDLLVPPITSTPKKGEKVPAIEDEDPSELTEEEVSEADVTGSTIYRDTTTLKDERQIPLEKQMTFLVFESAFRLLFLNCVACASAFVSIKRHIIGSFLSIKQVCNQCNNTFVWESQLYISNIPAGNLLTSAAILYTGSLPAKVLRIFKTLNCATISKVTYFRHQKATYTQPFMIFGRKTRSCFLANC